MKHEKPERAAARRRTTRSDVDEFAPGPRLPGSSRGGFDTAHSDATPGGTSGEHSGQMRPPAGPDSIGAEDDLDDEDREDGDEAPETPLDEPPPVPIVDPPTDATPGPPLTAAARPLLDRIEVAVGELSNRPESNAMLVSDIIQAVNGLRSLLGAVRSH